MFSIPTKVQKRLASTIKRFQPIIASAKARDLNESDTVIIITDMLSEVFGYDKYTEITSEQAIRSTFCDLAIKLDGQIKFLIEVKAIGLDLKEAYVKQAIDYAANQGIEWVVLTNGETWKIFKVTFGKPIGQDLILEFIFLNLNQKIDEHLSHLFILSKEGWNKSAINLHVTRQQALNRFNLGIIALSNPVLEVMRKELRRISPDVRIEAEEIKTIMMQEVLRREVVEGERAEAAKRQMNRVSNRYRKIKPTKEAISAEAATLSNATQLIIDNESEESSNVMGVCVSQNPILE